jgi:hypothetical protein
MKIAYIGFKNIMGIESLEFAPGKINIVEGKNGQGKTSVLKAIQGALGGGHDAKLLRNGEDKAEVVIVFDDGHKLHKEIKPGKSDVTLTDSSGKKVTRAASFLKSAIDAIGVNPVQILTASPKDRVSLLLDSVPMETPFEEIEKITGLNLFRDDARHPMQVLNENYKHFFDDRTETNRLLNEKKITVSKMRGALPFREEATGWGEILGKLNHDKEALADDLSDGLEANEVILENAIQVLKDKRDAGIEKLRADCEEGISRIREETAKADQEVRDLNTPQITALAEKIGEAKTGLENSGKIEATKAFVKEGEVEIADLEKDSAEMTEVIEGLKAIKADLLTNLPVDGLEIKDNEIYLDGVAFDSVNKAKRVQFALTIAGLRKAELPIVCVDDLETLDADSFAIFQEEAAKTEMQFFVTRVADDKLLTINTESN